MIYLFDADVAKEYGIPEATMIWNFQFWISKNRANGKHFYDGHYWTYNSIKAFQELFPFWSAQNIKTTLNHLKTRGVIMLGNYNKSSYDRTNWYAFVDEEKWLGQSQPLDRLDLTNRLVETNQPIPDTIPDNNIIKEKKIDKRKEKDPSIENLVDLLSIKTEEYYERKMSTSGWYEQLNLLVKKDGVSFKRIIDVINWHFAHMDRDFCHVICSGRALRDKFNAIESVMLREEGRENDF